MQGSKPRNFLASSYSWFLRNTNIRTRLIVADENRPADERTYVLLFKRLREMGMWEEV
ncbi:hypothetical protein [Paenibacillus aceris]|uniref:Uncharacterized protein n=1 Tax=Paenibacillus aceris TaxID=869555 RepID=A0ABS4I1Z8_9BACL|nr:hypothetical protein [Paenibacillus aceris]MBP1964932.1 hypothetical protein [Paenibacillus aceris]NHW35595.1 hypothetical protein [Paenibacillus aceris]